MEVEDFNDANGDANGDANANGHEYDYELNRWVWYLLIALVLFLLGLLYQKIVLRADKDDDNYKYDDAKGDTNDTTKDDLPGVDVEVASETTGLLSSAPTPKTKVLVLISSYSTNHQTKSNQDRALTILKGLQVGVGDDRLELQILDGANPSNKQQRNELFAVSGIRAKYPQFFLVQGGSDTNNNEDDDKNTTTTFLATYDDFEMMNEMGTLKEALNL